MEKKAKINAVMNMPATIPIMSCIGFASSFFCVKEMCPAGAGLKPAPTLTLFCINAICVIIHIVIILVTAWR